ncbi:hypothetical protein [Flavobacterium pectinovorum]|uniref:Uncharacterized protein n=1 Tax=Flavobacterium pectinovorum TaxID=29533 RepID=A0A502EUY1_9FLAO|nr:hypothetical protein [Flavobacterium pectinovorum]TPG41708.1 hypothetical protein EAH81_09515 [Flavobacterium pectinovorum]
MQKKERHGCLTAWLIYLIIAYSFSTILYFFKTDEMSKIAQYQISENMMLIHGSLGLLGILFSIMLFKWVKLGFWGIFSISIILFVLQLLNSNRIMSPIFIVICLVILFALLQIKKGNVSGWNNLE